LPPASLLVEKKKCSAASTEALDSQGRRCVITSLQTSHCNAHLSFSLYSLSILVKSRPQSPF
jgi:hypothetical protein